MTNPDNIVRVRARNGGRASVYEANGWAQAYTSGLLEGNGVTQNTSADMNVLVGGSATKPDVVLAINPADYKIGLDLVGQQAIAITAPASNSRISAIVAYTDDLSLATSEDTVTGSPSSCGLIVVNGTASASPSEPTDNQIRTAITADGATGSQAAYCVIATILVASNTTTITDSLITNKVAKLAGTGVVSSSNIDFTTMKKWVPDYSNKGSNILSGGTPITIDQDGFICYRLKRYGADKDAELSINGKLMTANCASSNAIADTSGVLPVCVGDVVSFAYNSDTGGNYICFVPGRWV